MNGPEGIMLSEVSQREKDKYCMLSPYVGLCHKTNEQIKQTHTHME